MKVPIVFNIYDLHDWKLTTKASDGNIYFDRPAWFTGLHVFMRLKVAWLVFVGKLDAVKWNHPDL